MPLALDGGASLDHIREGRNGTQAVLFEVTS